jgi:formate dehydrogenase subunit delta
MTSLDRLIHMANQIAANLETDSDPVAATANHIKLYWDPRMKQMIGAYVATGGAGLSVTAARALQAI